MGNCLRHESAMMWGGEDWGAEDHGQCGEMSEKGIMEIIEEKGLLKNDVTTSTTTTSTTTYGNYGISTNSSSSTSTTTTSTTEVKIKITKRQLEELLGKVDVKDLSVQQVLAQSINFSHHGCQAQHLRSWRPALQSIPELN